MKERNYDFTALLFCMRKLEEMDLNCREFHVKIKSKYEMTFVERCRFIENQSYAGKVADILIAGDSDLLLIIL